MKVERISRLKDYGIFHDFSWPSDLFDFKEKNLIYGWNGTGKTTLSELFRFLQIKQSLLPQDGRVEFVVEGNAVKGNEIANASLPQVRVFNRDTIERNVFELPNHELPPVYFLGEDSVDKENAVLRLKTRRNKADSARADWMQESSQAEANFERFCSAQALAIKNLLTVSGGGTYNNYNARNFKEDIQALLQAVPQPNKLSVDEKEACLSMKEDKARDKITALNISYPDFTSITNRAQRMLRHSVVSATIAELLDKPEVGEWVHKGLPLHSQDQSKCLFCDQPLPSERITALEAHFNDQFEQFQAEISRLIIDVQNAVETLSNPDFPNVNLLYPKFKTSYSEAVTEFGTQSFLANSYLESLITSLERKKAEPFRKFDLYALFSTDEQDEKPSILLSVLQIVTTMAGTMGAKLGENAFNKINSIIAMHNSFSDSFSEKVEAARHALAQNALIEAKAEYEHHQSSMREPAVKVQQADRIIGVIDRKVLLLEQDIQLHRKPAEELNREIASYLGRDELKLDVRETGYVITRNGEAAMKLSEGERTAIAFMYFLKSLEDKDFDLSSSVVVIDDPVSSLDANSLYCAFGFMKARVENAGQLFVLTHNFAFFRQVKNWFHHLPGQRKSNPDLRPARFYMLDAKVISGQRQSRLAALDPLLERYESEYHYLFSKMIEVTQLGSQGLGLEHFYGMPNIVRKVLEAFLAFKRPNESDLRQQLLAVAFDEAKKTRILRFLHTHSHSGQVDDPEHDLSILSETPQILLDVLALIRTEDEKHYNEMIKMLGNGQAEASS